MAATIGSLFGVVLGAALLGLLIAWLLRKILPMPLHRSYAIGVALATLAYLLLTDGLYTNFGSTAAGIAAGVLCGIAGFGVLVATARVRGS
ncbi:hypothetical protein [Neorhizobium sp. DT-125]|uniref:hypothetical protein n=1 Tax=Neorhizobium sp. DT-125 TaxID=3396163 RepID=UPI003F1BF947